MLVKQALVDDPSVASYMCGHVVGTALQMPGATERYTLLVDDDHCGTDAVLSMATMIGKLNCFSPKEKHAKISLSWGSKLYFDVNF